MIAEEPTVEVRATPSGHDTLVVDGRLVHSGRDPFREAERAMAEVVRRDPPCVVLFGLGLGYQARVVLENTENSRLLILEPSPGIRSLAHERGFPTEDPRTVVVATADELDHQLPLLAAAGYQMFELQNRFSPESELRERAHRVMNAFASRLEINQNTLNRFGRLWVRNLCRNLEALSAGIGVSRLRGKLSGLPALLLAAGPTLDEVLPSLPALSRRMAIVAVDTAVAHARSVGVEPDVAVVVDPQYWNARHLDTVSGTDALLVVETAAHPLVFRRFKPPYLFCSSVFPLGIRYEQRIGSFGQLGAGGSVSTTAWDLLRLMNASTVFAAGLDLGFPQNRTHCRGSFFEELAVALGTRIRPAEGVIFRYIYGANPHPVPDYAGGVLLSDARMDIYRSWFERRLREESLPTYVLSRTGSSISGTSSVTLASLLRLPALRSEIAGRLKDLRDLRRTTTASDVEPTDSIPAETDRLIGELDELNAIADEARQEIEAIAANHKAGRQVDFSSLAVIDARLLANTGRAIASFLMQDAIASIQSGFGSKDLSEQIVASRTLYESLADSIQFHREQLASARTRLDPSISRNP